MRAAVVSGMVAGLVLSGVVAVPADAGAGGGPCPPRGQALAYSDGLDKAVVDGVTVGGLSSLARDPRRRVWASTVDNHLSDPSRIWFFRGLRSPRIVGEPLVLRRPDGSAYDGTTADDEGLAVLRDGRYAVSSETEPSVRIYGRDGVQQASLPVPRRFRVAPAGEATANATLEGLTLSRDGRTLVAAMEGALSGDVGSDGDATRHRFLVYARHGRSWDLVRQGAYRAEPGQRVSEVAAYGRDGLVVMEASYDPATGNAVRLYAVSLRHAYDVSRVRDLSEAPNRVLLRKRLLADVAECPTLGAVAKQPQPNPLLDNYEGMAVTSERRGRLGVTLISDDNFGATQVTRLLDLSLRVR